MNLSQTRLRHVVVPVYLPGSSQAAGVVRVGNVFKDSQRRGFFRIGLFPVAVLEKVRCEVSQPENFAAVLSEMAGLTRLMRDTKSVEFRGIEWRLAGEAQPLVAARTATPASGGIWHLSGGVTVRCNGRAKQIPSASLYATGTGEVRLVWLAGSRTNQVTLVGNFPPIQSTTRKPS